MFEKTVYLVVGIGVTEAGTLGDPFCPTFPDCPGGPDGSPSPFDTSGYLNVKGAGTYSAIGARVFDQESDARNWLEQTPEGQRFKNVFLNVLIVRGSA